MKENCTEPTVAWMIPVKTNEFTLVISGISEITPDLASDLFQATSGDIEFNMCNGVAYLEFDREGSNLREAILSAISQVEGANLGFRVVRVESEAANTIAKINAELLGASSGYPS
jgi:hypothetical protein